MRIRPDQLNKRCGCKYCGQIKPARDMNNRRMPDGRIYIYPCCLPCDRVRRKNLRQARLSGLANKPKIIPHKVDVVTTESNKDRAHRENMANAFTMTTEYHCHGCGVVYAEICQCRKCGTYLTEKDGYTREKLLV